MSPEEKQLLRLYRSLSERGRSSLLDYAEFMQVRSDVGEAPPVSQAPLAIPRPESESVVKAIRRLKETYPMLDRDKLLHETSALMTRHLMQKRPAAEIIDELEALFRRHYDNQATPSIPQTTIDEPSE